MPLVYRGLTNRYALLQGGIVPLCIYGVYNFNVMGFLETGSSGSKELNEWVNRVIGHVIVINQ